MGLLDWITSERKGAAASGKTPERETLNPREHGHASMRDLAEEIRGDEVLRKLRDETGREPRTKSKIPVRERGNEHGR